MTNAERTELALLEAAKLPRDFKDDPVTPHQRKQLDRLYWLRLRAEGVSTWQQVSDEIARRVMR